MGKAQFGAGLSQFVLRYQIIFLHCELQLLPFSFPTRFPTNLLVELTKIFVKFPFVNLPLDLQFEKYMMTTALGKKRKKRLAKEAEAREAERLAAEKAAAAAARDKKR